MGADDDGDRIARLEAKVSQLEVTQGRQDIRLVQLEAQAIDMNRKLWAAVTVILLVVWNKVAAALGLGG